MYPLDFVQIKFRFRTMRLIFETKNTGKIEESSKKLKKEWEIVCLHICTLFKILTHSIIHSISFKHKAVITKIIIIVINEERLLILIWGSPTCTRFNIALELQKSTIKFMSSGVQITMTTKIGKIFEIVHKLHSFQNQYKAFI